MSAPKCSPRQKNQVSSESMQNYKGTRQKFICTSGCACYGTGAFPKLAQVTNLSARTTSNGGEIPTRDTHGIQSLQYSILQRRRCRWKRPIRGKGQDRTIDDQWALNAFRSTPFFYYHIIKKPIDEHSLQELTWNFLWQTDVMCLVRDEILADHSNRNGSR